MTVDTRTFDENNQPVAVMVVKGEFDVSRLVNLLTTGRAEDQGTAQRLARQLGRHNSGDRALALLRDHGGPDFTGVHGVDDVPAVIIDLLGNIYLYVNWRFITKQLTTEQRTFWADAVEAWSARLNAGTDETTHIDRWWLCPTCGLDIRNGLDDGPHEHCTYAEPDKPTEGQ